MSKTAGCSSVTESAASLGLLVVCARTGTAMQVESPTSAARRVTLIVIPGCSKAPGEMSVNARSQNAARKTKLHSSFLAGKRPTALTSGADDRRFQRRRERALIEMRGPDPPAYIHDPTELGASVASDDHRRWLATRAQPSARASKAIDRACLHVESSQIPTRFSPRVSVACFAATAVPKEALPTT